MVVQSGRTSNFFGVRPFFKKVFIAALVLLAFFLVWYARNLVLVLEPEGGLERQSMTTRPGDEWYLTYTHSVQRTPVWEYFRVNGANDQTMTHTVYSSLGVGLPYAPSEGKYHWSKEGRFDLEMNRPFKSVKLRTAVQAMHKFVHHGQVYDLCGLYGQGTLVEVKVEPRYQLWLEELGA
jgi:hypothetical protein